MKDFKCFGIEKAESSNSILPVFLNVAMRRR